MDSRPNRRNKTAFSNFSGVCVDVRNLILVTHVSTRNIFEICTKQNPLHDIITIYISKLYLKFSVLL